MAQLIQFSGFLGWLITTSAMASILAIGILLLKWLFKNQLDARWHSAIWLVLYLRLIVPWAPESNLSVFNWVKPTAVVEASSISSYRDSVKTIDATGVRQEEATLPPTLSGAAPASARERNSQINWTWLNWLWIIWLTGAASLALYYAIPNIRFAHKIGRLPRCSKSRLMDIMEHCKRRMAINFTVNVIETNAVTGPVLFGTFRPALLLPPGIADSLSFIQVEHIFLHELAHLKRKDTLRSWLMHLLIVFHWFNPLLWVAFRTARLDQEIACDALALNCLPKETRVQYGHTIIKLLEGFGSMSFLPGSSPILGGKDIKMRLKRIKGFSRASIGWSIVGVIIIILVSTTALTNAVSKKAASDQQITKPVQEIIEKLASEYGIKDPVVTLTAGYTDGSQSPMYGVVLEKRYVVGDKEYEKLAFSVLADGSKYWAIRLIPKADIVIPTRDAVPGNSQDEVVHGFLEEKGYKLAVNGIGVANIILPNSFDTRKGDAKIGELVWGVNRQSKQNGLDFSGYLGKQLTLYACGLEQNGNVSNQQAVLLLDGTKVVGYWLDSLGGNVSLMVNLLQTSKDHSYPNLNPGVLGSPIKISLYNNGKVYEFTNREEKRYGVILGEVEAAITSSQLNQSDKYYGLGLVRINSQGGSIDGLRKKTGIELVYDKPITIDLTKYQKRSAYGLFLAIEDNKVLLWTSGNDKGLYQDGAVPIVNVKELKQLIANISK